MQKWEYMFAEVWRNRVNVIEGQEIKRQDQQDWPIWLRERGLEGWELASEITFAAYKTHATLKRPIE
jgi:hypothetical protein